MKKSTHVEFDKRLHGNVQYIRKQPRLLQFQISFSRNRTTFAATRHVLWALNAPKCIGDRAQVMRLVAAILFSSLGE